MRLLTYRILCCLLILPFAACGSRDSNAALRDSLTTVVSWAATAQMTGEAWADGRVPNAYAQQTLEKAQESIEREADALGEKSTSLSVDERRLLLSQLSDLEATLEEMRAAVEDGDRAGAAAQADRLRKVEEAIKALTTRRGAAGAQQRREDAAVAWRR